MVKAPVGVVAMIYDADLLSSPYSRMLETVEKKGQYLLKRIERLKQLNLEAENGKELGEVKDEARKKLPEVEQQMEYMKFLAKSLKEQHREFVKLVKERDVAVKAEMSARQSAAILDASIFREIIGTMNRPIVKKSYQQYQDSEDGRTEDVLSSDDWSRLGLLAEVFHVSHEDTGSFTRLMEKSDRSAKLMNTIISQDPVTEVIVGGTGFDVYTLLMTVRESQFWTSSHGKHIHFGVGNKKENKKESSSQSSQTQRKGPANVETVNGSPPKVSGSTAMNVSLKTEKVAETEVQKVKSNNTSVAEITDELAATGICDSSAANTIVFGYSHEETPVIKDTTVIEQEVSQPAPVISPGPPSDPEQKSTSPKKTEQGKPHRRSRGNRSHPSERDAEDSTQAVEAQQKTHVKSKAVPKKSPKKPQSEQVAAEIKNDSKIQEKVNSQPSAEEAPRRVRSSRNGQEGIADGVRPRYNNNNEGANVAQGNRRGYFNDRNQENGGYSAGYQNGNGYSRGGFRGQSRNGYENAPMRHGGVRRPPPGESGFVFARV